MDNLFDLDFEAMKNTDIRTVDPDSLVDICDIKIDTDAPKEQRLLDFIRQIKNPYCYKCGKMVVKVNFSNNGSTLEDKLESFLLSL